MRYKYTVSEEPKGHDNDENAKTVITYPDLPAFPFKGDFSLLEVLTYYMENWLPIPLPLLVSKDIPHCRLSLGDSAKVFLHNTMIEAGMKKEQVSDKERELCDLYMPAKIDEIDQHMLTYFKQLSLVSFTL